MNNNFSVGKPRYLSFVFRDFEVSCAGTDFFILVDGLTCVFPFYIRVTDKSGYTPGGTESIPSVITFVSNLALREERRRVHEKTGQ